jgi:hypothetical protein
MRTFGVASLLCLLRHHDSRANHDQASAGGAQRFESIEFISYRDKEENVGCGPRPASEMVYLTWKGNDTGGAEIRSASIVVELTPVGYKP